MSGRENEMETENNHKISSTSNEIQPTKYFRIFSTSAPHFHVAKYNIVTIHA